MKLRALFGSITLAATVAAGPAFAVPTLQLDIKDGTYFVGPDDTWQHETVFASGNTFALYAYLVPASSATLTDNYYLSMALMPPSSSGGSMGSFTINGQTVNVTGDMTYGTPPLETILGGAATDPGDLAPHAAFPSYFAELKFNFSPVNTSAVYNTQQHAGWGPQPGSGMYFAKFDVDLTNLGDGHAILFDLYNESLITKCKSKSCTLGDIDVNQFAPFSHDAAGEKFVTTIPEPETYALLLAGLGLLGFAARRRTA